MSNGDNKIISILFIGGLAIICGLIYEDWTRDSTQDTIECTSQGGKITIEGDFLEGSFKQNLGDCTVAKEGDMLLIEFEQTK